MTPVMLSIILRGGGLIKAQVPASVADDQMSGFESRWKKEIESGSRIVTLYEEDKPVIAFEMAEVIAIVIERGGSNG